MGSANERRRYIIMDMDSTNERKRYIVTLPLIGGAHTQNNSCYVLIFDVLNCYEEVLIYLCDFFSWNAFSWMKITDIFPNKCQSIDICRVAQTTVASTAMLLASFARLIFTYGKG